MPRKNRTERTSPQAAISSAVSEFIDFGEYADPAPEVRKRKAAKRKPATKTGARKGALSRRGISNTREYSARISRSKAGDMVAGKKKK